MEVILLERIERLGQMGDTVTVKPGFARNYLLPQKKALRATVENKARFEAERVQLEADNLKSRQDAEAVAKKADGITVVLVRQAGDAGQLYGSVTARDIAHAITADGVSVNRSQVMLDKPIKALGLHDVRVDLHPEVSITATVNVARSTEEAELQAKTGSAVLSIDEQERADAAAVLTAAAAEEVFEEDAADVEEIIAETEEAVAELAEENSAGEDDGTGSGDEEATAPDEANEADNTEEPAT